LPPIPLSPATIRAVAAGDRAETSITGLILTARTAISPSAGAREHPHLITGERKPITAIQRPERVMV
jgi:hypothetical protein